ncbi:MAG: glycoside hydrolase family 3 C-terminal domain-containing protein [Lachnospiraceae bacterium]|nr:glycoside hydrolase family 3 C-terminal domain-containing protein [Lachnospiraceae bacterium]
MKTNEEIKSIISTLTLEEKASLCSGATFWLTKEIPAKGIPRIMVSDGPVGLRKQENIEDHLGMNESIKAVCFPAGVGMAATFNRELYGEMGETLGEECRAKDVAVILGPAVNIKRSPLCGRNFEYLSEDPYLASEMSTAYINGVQSKHVGTSIKHFAVNNMETRRFSASSNLSERALREIYLAAFEGPVKNAKPWTVMCSYNRINGELASQNKYLLTDILRKDWGYEGNVVSDWGAVSDRAKALEAGLNLEMPTSYEENDKKLVEAVKNGTLDEKVLDANCESLLKLIFDAYDNIGNSSEFVFDLDAHHDKAKEIAAETFVLLKNEGNVLPLKKDAKIAVIGSYAKVPRFQGGGSAHINCHKIVGFLDACKENGLNNITFAEGFSGTKDNFDQALCDEAVKNAKDADVAVIFAGLPDIFESEGYDRKHMNMPACQLKVIEEVRKVAKKTVIVLHNGSPIEMPFVNDVDAILECYLGGQAVGSAQFDVIFGDKSPSGRLAETFPIRLEDNPSYLNFPGFMNNVNYAEDIFVGYRYYDKKKMNVLFPFGYGLSYTEFKYDNLRLSKSEMKDTDTLEVSVDITNVGSVASKEVVQLYVKNCDTPILRPIREFKGFDKVYLKPGETKTVTFSLDKRSFAYYEERISDWAVPAGTYSIEIGKNSRCIELSKEVNITSEPVLPDHYDYDTITEELMLDPRIKDIRDKYFNMEDAFKDRELSEVEKESMNEEMAEAGFLFSPLRSALYFTGGSKKYEDIDKFLAEVNERIKK